ncbi:MAG: hypothetical protein WC205_03520 [Opitutaceae bacterium]|jgi:predicted Zn-dependent protease
MAASRHFLFLLCALLAFTASAFAQPSAQPTVSEAVASELGKLRELTTAQDYAPALVIIDRLLGTVEPDSYDLTLLSQIKAQIFLTQGRYTAAITPLETALRSAAHPGYLTDSAHTETLFLLAQLYQQQAAETKDHTLQRPLLAQSADYLARSQARTPTPGYESRLFGASLFYQQAVLDPDHLDSAALNRAQHEAAEALLSRVTPTATPYALLLATHQQRGEQTQVADLLELLVEKTPDNAGYWNQLVATYLALAANATDPRSATRANLRALFTLERAQSRNLLTTPADHFNQVALNLSLHQFDAAIALLEKGLADGSLENSRRNWDLLATTYQQLQREPDAIATLEKAAARFPSDGQLEFRLAQLLYARNRATDALRHLELAVKKGRLDTPGQTHLFLAYIAYELKAYEDAARWARAAADFADVKKDDLARLNLAIADATKGKS